MKPMPTTEAATTDDSAETETPESSEATATVPTPKGFEDCSAGEKLVVVSNENGQLTFEKDTESYADDESDHGEMGGGKGMKEDMGPVAVVIARRMGKK